MDTHEQTTAKSRYNELMNLVTGDGNYLHVSDVFQSKIDELTSALKHTVVDVNAAQFEKDFLKLKFILLEHIGEERRGVLSENFLEASALENSNFPQKYISTSIP